MSKQRFSLRKYKFGVASVLLGSVLVFGAGNVSADETKQPETAVIASAEANPALPSESSSPVSDQANEQTRDSVVENGKVVDEPASSEKGATSPSVESGSQVVAQEAKTEDKATEKQVEAVTKNEAKPAEKASEGQEKTEVKPSSTEEKAEAKPATEARAEKKAEDKPFSISSNTIINVPQTWEKGYKGEGTVVAVIDSGLDVYHEVLRISDPTKGKFKNQTELEAAKKAAGIDYGKWYNDKVVFAYDYMDGDDNIKEKDHDSHGMHVTGIATGNPDKKAGDGNYVYGVAPEAQVMFMRVFSDRSGSTSDVVYVKAIDDAVALGADVINMSLGSVTGSTVNASPAVREAIQRARAKGVSVIIAAGNSNTYGYGYDNPSAENPDYGVVGSPSTVEESISVASVNDSVVTEEVFTVRGLEDNADLDKGKFTYTAAETDANFENGKEYDYVDAGLGRESDLDSLDLTGKVALIKRGEITFSDKVANVYKKGAIGALIYNSVEGANVKMGLEGDARKIPAVFISKRYGEAIKGKDYKLVFDGSLDNRPNPDADKMSDFSSWGVSTDGQLKPDVTAPGGSIFSSLNDNSYGSMSGTSMASPHVAGVSALVKEYLQTHHPELSPEELSATVKALIMSTAKPHLNKETGAYTSVRQQGAGIVDTAAAVSTDLYVTNEDAYPSVTLGNVEDRFSFDVTVHNISDTDRELKMIVNTTTDDVKDDRFTLKPRKLTETVWPNVTVKAHSSQTVTVTVDASKFAEELTKLMPNGYFLEGFVRFVDPADDGDVVSIPFMGFRGSFQNIPAVEKPIYNLVREGKSGFYYDVPETKHVPSKANVTSLVSNANDVLYSTAKKETAERSPIVLGTVETPEGLNVLHLDADGNVRLAISPDGDGNKDYVQYRAVVLRNLKNMKAAVYKADDQAFAQPVWTSTGAFSARKNYFDGRGKQSYLVDNTAWEGTDAKGEKVADGHYVYEVRYTPAVPGADEQVVRFNLQIDTQKPVLTSGYTTKKDGVETFYARKTKDVGNGGILREQVFYVKAFDEEGTLVKEGKDALGKTSRFENRVYLTANEDGGYTLPEGISKDLLYYVVEDYAGNRDFASLADFAGTEDSGRIKVSVLDADTHQELDTDFVYRIKDDQGRYVNLDKGKEINFLKFGSYVAELFAYDKSDLKLVSERTQKFEITADDSFKTIEFLAKEIVTAPLSLVFDQAVPRTTPVVLKNQAGETFVLPVQRYGKNAFGKDVPVGTYTISVSLPTGYELFEDAPTVTVLADQNNLAKLSVVIKTQLLQLLAQQANLTSTPQYFNATSEKRLAYDAAYKEAQKALATKLSQAEVDQIFSNLGLVTSQLDGKESDFTALKSAIAAYDVTSKTGRYANAKDSARRAFDQSFKELALLLVREGVTQEQINQALANYQAADQQLTGKTTDFSSLKKLIAAELQFQAKNAKFIYAADKVKVNYLQAIIRAQAVLANPGASQQEVKAALAEVKVAKKKLNGKKPKVAKRP